MTFKQQRKGHHGIDVIYSRGADSVDDGPIRGLIGDTPMMVTNSTTGIQLRVTNRDYCFLPEDLVIGGNQIWPEPGDRITEADGTVYEVPRRLHDQPAWTWHSQLKQVMRVHTQLVLGT